jgi:hypothetical protein
VNTSQVILERQQVETDMGALAAHPYPDWDDYVASARVFTGASQLVRTDDLSAPAAQRLVTLAYRRR